MSGTVRIGAAATRLVTLAAAWLLAGVGPRAQAPVRWAVCYSDRPAPADLARYDLVVLDAVHHPPLAPILERRRTVLAYLSLTEIGRAHDAFPGLERAGVVLDAHPAWSGTHYLDFRRPEWTRAVLEHLVPRALAAGFNGIFLDTLDDAAFLEGRDPQRYRGMREAAVRLVRAIRQQHPHMVLMVNRGYDLLPEIAGSIDILLGESVVATFDPATKAYARVTEADVAWQVQALRQAKTLNPALQILTLDYWDPADVDGIQRIYREQRANGFSPYVATPMLDVLVEEPR